MNQTRKEIEMTEYFCTFDSPLGKLLLTSNGTALTELSLHGPKPNDGRRRDGSGNDEVLAAAHKELSDYFAGKLQRFEVPLCRKARHFNSGFGGRCSTSRSARRKVMDSSPGGSETRRPREPSVWPMGATRLPSSSLATGSSAQTAPSSATAAACLASAGYWITRPARSQENGTVVRTRGRLVNAPCKSVCWH